jgi:transposase, IS5 family
LEEMERVVPWSELVALIEPHSPRAKTGRPPFPIATMLRIHFMQQWFGLSDPAMEEALFDMPLYREFAQLPEGMVRLPDESTILRFRHLLEKHGLAAQMFAAINATLSAKGLILKTGSVVDATLIAAPSSTKNSTGTRDPEMHQTKKGNNWYFGMKAHIAVDADSGLVHHHVCTAANVHDLRVVDQLLHGKEKHVFADSGYRGIAKWSRRKRIRWSVAMTPGHRKALDLNNPIDALKDQAEQIKASIRAKVEHPFRVIKRQFGYAKARYRGLAKNAAQVTTLFMLCNLWMVRRKLGSTG